MKISFWITGVILSCAVKLVFPYDLQVGTVLFTTTDIVKKCWTENDKALLRARLIMQDVLPATDSINFSKPGIVLILLEYFQSCYDIITTSTYGKAQNLMLLAVSDAFGGYLRAYILPLAKRAFYAGQINYAETSKLFHLYNDIKTFLKTNGNGWAKPYRLPPLHSVPKPLVISSTGGQSACSQLYIIERNTKFHFNMPQKMKSNLCAKPHPRKLSKKTKCKPKMRRVQVQVECPQPQTPPNEGPTDQELEMLQNMLIPTSSDVTFTEVPTNYMIESTDISTDSGVRNERKSEEKKEWEQSFHNESVTEKEVEKSVQKRRADNNVKNDSLNSNKNRSQCLESKEGLMEDTNCGEDPMMEWVVTVPEEQECEKKFMIPLPILDDSVTPFTLGVPFKCQPLRNIRGRSSAFILEHYYVAVIKCMIHKGSSNSDIKQFNAHFFSWLCSQVYPHLVDEIWYPAFGGVLRIAETIKKLGADSSIKEPCFNDVGFIFQEKFGFDDCKRSGKEKVRQVQTSDNYKGEELRKFKGKSLTCPGASQKKRYVVYGILIGAVWTLFAFLAFFMYTVTARRRKDARSICFTYDKKILSDDNCLDTEKPPTPKSTRLDCRDQIKAELKAVKKMEKADKKVRRELEKKLKKGKRKLKLKRVPEWKKMMEAYKGGGDRLPLFKFPWTFTLNKKQEKSDSSDSEESSSKCLVQESKGTNHPVSSSPIWPSQSPFIALQKLNSGFNMSNMTSMPVSTEVSQDIKFQVLRNPLDKIQLVWKKPPTKKRKADGDKETQDTEKLIKSSEGSTLESSKRKEPGRDLPSDVCTYSVEDEKICQRVGKVHDHSEGCPLSYGISMSSESDSQESSSTESEGERDDDSYSSESHTEDESIGKGLKR